MSVQSAVSQWQSWKDAGKAPATRAAAFKIISSSLSIPITKLKNAYSLQEESNGTEVIDDRLSLMVWDLKENGGRLGNYDRDVAFFQNLLAQFGNYLSVYTRVTMKIAGKTMTVPTRVSTPNGSVLLSRMTPSQLEEVADQFIAEARLMVRRWKVIGAQPGTIIKALRALAVEVEEEAMVAAA